MDYGLVIRALEKHLRMAQAAVNFAREQGKGQLYSEAIVVLTEAQRAMDHVKKQREETYAKTHVASSPVAGKAR